jgi:hypothetical protein
VRAEYVAEARQRDVVPHRRLAQRRLEQADKLADRVRRRVAEVEEAPLAGRRGVERAEHALHARRRGDSLVFMLGNATARARCGISATPFKRGLDAATATCTSAADRKAGLPIICAICSDEAMHTSSSSNPSTTQHILAARAPG